MLNKIVDLQLAVAVVLQPPQATRAAPRAAPRAPQATPPPQPPRPNHSETGTLHFLRYTLLLLLLCLDLLSGLVLEQPDELWEHHFQYFSINCAIESSIWGLGFGLRTSDFCSAMETKPQRSAANDHSHDITKQTSQCARTFILEHNV